MHSHSSRLFRLLRASMLVALVLGLTIGPVLSQLGDLHAVEHSFAATADAPGHDHGDDEGGRGHGHDHSNDTDHDTDEDGKGKDHSAGAHALMHQSGIATTLTGLASALTVPTAFGRMPDLPLPSSARIPRQNLTTPFRPPIA
jgi:hypothetical protein